MTISVTPPVKFTQENVNRPICNRSLSPMLRNTVNYVQQPQIQHQVQPCIIKNQVNQIPIQPQVQNIVHNQIQPQVRVIQPNDEFVVRK